MTTMKKIKGMLSPLEDRIQVLEAAMALQDEGSAQVNEPAGYVVNTAKRRFHQINCPCLKYSNEKNLMSVLWDRQRCIDNEFKPCKHCIP